MPFTFSHPAAVLPIHSRFKNWIPLSALVIGSLVPDAAYYLPMPEHFKQNSHTLLGTLVSSLPAGIFVWLIFYWLAPPAVFLLPDPHREAIGSQLKSRSASVQEALGVIAGILIGAWSHVLWDSFTHERGFVVKQSPLLERPIFGTMPAYRALEYLSSIFGLCVLLYAYSRWMKVSELRPWMWRRPCWRSYLWLGVAAICFVAAAMEAHFIKAIASLYFVHRGHLALAFFTIFVRDTLIALFVVLISVKLFGLGVSRRHSHHDLA